MEKCNLILLQATQTNDGLMGWGLRLFVLGFLFYEEWGWWWGCTWWVFFLSDLRPPATFLPPLVNWLFNVRHKRIVICFCVTINKGQNQMLQEGQSELTGSWQLTPHTV